ncbi:RILP-like protein homolog [Toxorhynchites rutilus septentrionalis]|uniref:RILP-like protein homolog n=1 Tax=Toxorhynchites rutilus septentrionalis TaxID=329112 RepID=UPI002478D715|nr:RILP-like protein homolog [Toxorhynchites rutilus septentrionalis]XP_055621279.1 RILP-like protein homolog [Toxorhynchites rutilus septentrionalis]
MDTTGDISVVDVYDLAANIGKEFEKIIDENGPDSVSGLIPKVIHILELLETIIISRENESSLVQDLNDKISQLEIDKSEKAEFKKKADKEMESIEEQWRIETRDLLQLISRLQAENRRLTKAQVIEVTPRDLIQDSHDILHTSSDMHCLNCDSSTISQLKLKLSEQNDDIKSKERELLDKLSEINNMAMQVDRLKNTVSETRRRQKLMQNQMLTLLEERADFLAQLQDQQHEIMTLRKQLGIAEKENEDLTNMAKEDDRPRFSTVELKEILAERNELKIRVSDLEQDLLSCNQPDPLSNDNIKIEDLPVQGPLPYEPDDAPWKKHSESGVRKFFRKLFSDVDASNLPRRSVSTLTKLALSSGPHSDIPI